MATLPSTNLLSKISGKLGKQLVFKQYGDKIVVSIYPDMSRVKPSMKQKQSRLVFKQAVAYAKNINNKAELKKQYLKRVKKGESVYHFALKEYLKKHKH